MAPNQHRRYCGAFFGHNEKITQEWAELYWSYFCTAPEVCPKTNRPHLQWYGVTKKHTTKTGCAKLWAAIGEHSHCEPCDGDHNEGILYCSGPYNKNGKVKETNNEWKVWVDNYDPEGGRPKKCRWTAALASATEGNFGEIDPQIQITQYQNLRRVHADARDAQDLNEPCGLWIWGPAGSGKSTKARSYGDYFLKDVNKWWDLYSGQDNAILEDLDPQSAKSVERYLKIWGDQFAFVPEVKGASAGKIRPKLFIVTSQWSIAQITSTPETFAALDRRYTQIEMRIQCHQPLKLLEVVTTRSTALAVLASNATQSAQPANDPTTEMIQSSSSTLADNLLNATELESALSFLDDMDDMGLGSENLYEI